MPRGLRYSEQFKNRVVKAAMRSGNSQLEVAKEFRIHPKTVREWMRASVSVAANEDASEERKDGKEEKVAVSVVTLSDRISRLEEERDYLRSFIAYLMK